MGSVDPDAWGELERAEAAADENGRAVVRSESRIEALTQEEKRGELREEWLRLRTLYGLQDELEMAVARARAEAEATGAGPQDRAAA
jgi:hypothetical protein